MLSLSLNLCHGYSSCHTNTVSSSYSAIDLACIGHRNPQADLLSRACTLACTHHKARLGFALGRDLLKVTTPQEGERPVGLAVLVDREEGPLAQTGQTEEEEPLGELRQALVSEMTVRNSQS